jgi:uncharacterized paraquat-inducible protein A
LTLSRCSDCNATIKSDELQCYSCGTRVDGRRKSKLGAGFATFLTILFLTSALLTVGSLFVEQAPPFGKCLMVTIVLLVVRGSAGDMSSKSSS